MASILNEKKVFLTVQERRLSFRSVDNAVISSEEKSYTCFHEEADTRIIYHISKVKPRSKIMIQATDTDILIILLGNMHNLNDKQIFMEMEKAQKLFLALFESPSKAHYSQIGFDFFSWMGGDSFTDLIEAYG